MSHSIKITSIPGNTQRLDGGAMFGNAPRAVWEKWTTPDELGRIPLACRAFLVETEGKKILLETGIGAFFEPKLADRFGVQNADTHELLESLNKQNVSPEQIDFVILSHLHFDHAGGLLNSYSDQQQNGMKLVFPNAQFVVGREAWNRATQPHFRDRASFIQPLTELLTNSGNLVIVEDDLHCDVLPKCFSFFISNGHTPGQLHTIITDGDQKYVFAGDLIPGRHWVHLPITMGYDRFPELLIEEKENLFERMPPSTFYLFVHDPDYAGCQVTKDERGKMKPVDLHENFVEYTA